MKANKEEMIVSALRNGTVIDHVPSDKLFEIVDILRLADMKNQITIGNNLESKKIGSKGIIKISDKFFEKKELGKIAIIAPKANISIIRDFEVVEKFQLSLPDEITGIIRCANPKCITNNERDIVSRFDVIDKENLAVRCHYCEKVMNKEDIVLN